MLHRFTRFEIAVTALLTLATVLLLFAGGMNLGGLERYIVYGYLVIVPLWVALPMWLAGRHQGWGPLRRPWQEDEPSRPNSRSPRS